MSLKPYTISKPNESGIYTVRDRKTRTFLGLIRNTGTRRDPEWTGLYGRGYLRIDDAARTLWAGRETK